MKTVSSMRNKFQVYLNKVGKEGQTSVQKPKLSKQQLLTTKADGLISALVALPLNELTEDDRNGVLTVLDGVRSKIEEIYNALNPQPVPEEPVNSNGPSTNLA